MKIAVAPLVALLVLASGPALAAEGKRGPMAACRADAEKLCQDVAPGDGRMATCLTKNEAKVSPKCKDAMAKARAREGVPAPAPVPAPKS